MPVFSIVYYLNSMLIIEIDKGQTKVKTIVNFSTTRLTFKGGYNMNKFEQNANVTWFPTQNIDILSPNIELDLTDNADNLEGLEPRTRGGYNPNVASWFPTGNIDHPSNIELDLKETKRPTDKAIYQKLEEAFSNYSIWETYSDDFIPSPELEKSFYNEAINHRDKITTKKSFEEVLAIFDTWAGTTIDILSPYGDIDFGNNIFADNFTMDVPVKIYSEKEDLVFQIDAPWMKVESFDDADLFPSRLNLKSVLSMLPVTVNSKELKASYVNGEFRLEVPKKEITVGKERKNG